MPSTAPKQPASSTSPPPAILETVPVRATTSAILRYTSVVAVAATTSSNGSPCFSSTGPDVELAAPGFEVNSTLPGGIYGLGSGTSMASPHVAGTPALVLNAGAIDVMMIDGRAATPVTDDFHEVGPATYSWSIAVPAAFGTHTVVTKVTYDQVTGGGSATFTVADPFVMRVASIGYTQNGGPKNNRNLRIAVGVVSGTGAAVADATVSIVIRRNGVVYTGGTARTATDGRAIFELKNAPLGTYQTQITGAAKGGLTWDQATPPNQYSK